MSSIVSVRKTEWVREERVCVPSEFEGRYIKDYKNKAVTVTTLCINKKQPIPTVRGLYKCFRVRSYYVGNNLLMI